MTIGKPDDGGGRPAQSRQAREVQEMADVSPEHKGGCNLLAKHSGPVRWTLHVVKVSRRVRKKHILWATRPTVVLSVKANLDVYTRVKSTDWGITSLHYPTDTTNQLRYSSSALC